MFIRSYEIPIQFIKSESVRKSVYSLSFNSQLNSNLLRAVNFYNGLNFIIIGIMKMKLIKKKQDKTKLNKRFKQFNPILFVPLLKFVMWRRKKKYFALWLIIYLVLLCMLIHFTTVQLIINIQNPFENDSLEKNVGLCTIDLQKFTYR